MTNPHLDKLKAISDGIDAGRIPAVLDRFESESVRLLAKFDLPNTPEGLKRRVVTSEYSGSVYAQIRVDETLPEEVRLAAELLLECVSTRDCLERQDHERALQHLNRVWVLTTNIVMIGDEPALKAFIEQQRGAERGRQSAKESRDERKKLVREIFEIQKERNPRASDWQLFSATAEVFSAQYSALLPRQNQDGEPKPLSADTVRRYLVNDNKD